MNRIFLILLLGGLSLGTAAQHSAPASTNKKTFIISKDTIGTTTKKEKKAVVVAPAITVEATKGVEGKKVITRYPTIAGGVFGMMNITAYHEQMIFYDWNYVILQYDVSSVGRAINIKTAGCSSNQFAGYVVNKLKQAKWNPALDQNGQPVRHRLFKQVVIVKQKMNEEDYFKDY